MPNKLIRESLSFYRKYGKRVSSSVVAHFRETYMMNDYRVTFQFFTDGEIWMTHYYNDFKISDIGLTVYIH